MQGMKLSDLELKKLMPVFMQNDEAVKALCTAVDKLLHDPCERIPTMKIWGETDNLSEDECDELAWEQDIDWYDSSASLEVKRQIVSQAQEIKRRRGTKWAVEQLVSAYFGSGYVFEWFEVPELTDEPYTFVVLSESEISDDDLDKFIAAAEIAKNERSHIAGIYIYLFECKATIEVHWDGNGYAFDYARRCGTYPESPWSGFQCDDEVDASGSSEPYFYSVPACGTINCGTYPA